jgi:DNA-binding CsgD family transcriptional regulator
VREPRSGGVRGPALDDPAALTPREREVLALLADGDTDRRIAERLCVSPKTVEKHVASLRAKLGAPSRAAAVAQAARRDLI